MKQKFSLSLLVPGLILSIVLSSCAPAPTAVPTVVPTVEAAVVSPTVSSLPSSTPEPSPTAEPTATATPEEPISFINPQKYTVEYKITIKNDGFNPSDIRLYLPQPGEWDAQRDLKINQVSPEPKSQQAEKNSGNSMIFWKLSGSPKKNTTENLILSFDLTAYETITNIDPTAVQPYNTNSDEYKRFTAAEKYIESDDPKIIQLANKLAGDETNPYLQAYSFYSYIVNNAQYKLLGQGLNGAKYLMDKGNGECGDYSALFIALSRAKGIPARPVVGYWAISGNDQTHVWAEFYLEGIGWIPVDATIGQQSNANYAYYFGNMDNKRVILSKGYNTALVPSGPDGYIAPILQVPMWWFWGSGDANKISLDRSWKVSKKD
jgi:transglutaminase-like putative cysteine protease